MVAGLVGFTLTKVMSPEDLNSWGWRVPFVFGLLVLPIGIYIRRNLAETFHGHGEQTSTGDLVREVCGKHRRALVLGLLILSGSTITQFSPAFFCVIVPEITTFPSASGVILYCIS